jgi:hypothetical protein
MHLPDGAEAGFRLVVADAFGGTLAINVYGGAGMVGASLHAGIGTASAR